MTRLIPLCSFLMFSFSLVGCSHFMETRTLKQFVTALEEEDLETLRAASSDSFDEKALRLDASAEDLQLLHIPTDDFEIVEVKEESETSKLVNVRIGESRKTVVYRLVKEEGSRKWVVDDIFMKKTHDGNLKVTKKVTEQMDLYLSVREFLETWNKKDRSAIERKMTKEFAGVMHELPDDYFAHLHEKVGDVKRSLERFKPKATLNEDTAVVRLERKAGRLDIGLKLVGDQWLVKDMAIESSRDQAHITSMIKAADGMRSVAIFLKGYSDSNKDLIQNVTASSFYKNAILPGKLTDVSLPAAESLNADTQMKIRGERIDIDIPFNGELASITLKATERPDGEWKQPGYYVTDVSLVGSGADGEVRKLSALLTSKARVDIFHEALVKRDLKVLTYSSSYDFNNRVWQNVDANILPLLPIDLPSQGNYTIEDIVFDGTLTQVYVLYGNLPITYVLRENSGELRIDDVQFPTPGRPNSVKQLLEAVVPVYQFAKVAAQSAPPADYQNPTSAKELQKLGNHYQETIQHMQGICSFDFNHTVWKDTDIVPTSFFNCSEHLKTPVTAVRSLNENEQLIQFGDEHWGALVKVVQEQGAYRVDEVNLIAGQDARYDLKIAARDELNENGRYLRSLYPLLGLPGESAPVETQIAKQKKSGLEEYQFSDKSGESSDELKQEQPTENITPQYAEWDDFNSEIKHPMYELESDNPFLQEEQKPNFSGEIQQTDFEKPVTEPKASQSKEFPSEFPPLDVYPSK